MSTPVSDDFAGWDVLLATDKGELRVNTWALRALCDRAMTAEAQLARIKSRVTDLVDAGWLSLEAATELRNVYDGDEEGQR